MGTADLKSKVFSRGSIFLKPGVFRISQWVNDFNPKDQRVTNTQVWIRIFNLPLEYWRTSILFGIARGVGIPLQIDRKTITKEFGLYARILVDVDLARELTEQILVTRRNFEFFVSIEYEKCPRYCHGCGVIGHGMEDCKKNFKDNQ